MNTKDKILKYKSWLNRKTRILNLIESNTNELWYDQIKDTLRDYSKDFTGNFYYVKSISFNSDDTFTVYWIYHNCGGEYTEETHNIPISFLDDPEQGIEDWIENKRQKEINDKLLKEQEQADKERQIYEKLKKKYERVTENQRM